MKKLVKNSVMNANWAELIRSDESIPWVIAKLEESYYQAMQDDDQRESIVQQGLQRITEFLWRFVAAVQGQ